MVLKDAMTLVRHLYINLRRYVSLYCNMQLAATLAIILLMAPLT